MVRGVVIAVCCALALAVGLDAAAAAPTLGAPAAVKAKRKTCKLKRKAACKRAVIKGAKIGRRNLAGSKLQNARITGTTFTKTNLKGASFKGATLRNVTFKGADLSATSFSGAVLDHVRFVGVDFGAAAKARCLVVPASTSWKGKAGCSSPGSMFMAARIADTAFVASDLNGSNWTLATFDNVLFSDCDLDAASFERSTWKRGSVILGSREAIGNGASARFSDFNETKGLAIMKWVDVAYASFMGAEDVEINPTGARREGIRGPAATVGTLSVDVVDPTAISNRAIAFVSEESPVRSDVQWGFRDCVLGQAARCGTTDPVLVGRLGRIELSAPDALKAVGPGVDCDAPSSVDGRWVTVCHVEIGEDTAVAITAATTPVRTVTVLRPEFGSGAPMVTIRALHLYGTETAYAAVCAEGWSGSCVLKVPQSAHVRVEAKSTRVDWSDMDCPGGAEELLPFARNVLFRCSEQTIGGADVTGSAQASG